MDAGFIKLRVAGVSAKALSSWIYPIARKLAADATRTPRREEQLDDEGWQQVADQTACVNNGAYKIAALIERTEAVHANIFRSVGSVCVNFSALAAN